MPKTSLGRLMYALVMLTGLLLLGSSLYRKHHPVLPAPLLPYMPKQATEQSLRLGQAIDAGNKDAVVALLRSHLDLGLPVDAIQYGGNSAAVEALLRSDPDLRVPAGAVKGETAIERAAMRGQAAITRLLLDYGADPKAALDAAIDGLYHGYTLHGKPLPAANYRAILAMLQARGLRLSPMQTVKLNDVAALNAASKSGAALNYAESYDRTTPLIAAVVDGNFLMARWLLALGAQPDAANTWKQTPLMAAVSLRNRKTGCALAELLLAHGANVNARDDYGQTPLIYTVTNDRTGAMTEWLLNRSADLKIFTDKPAMGGSFYTGKAAPIELKPQVFFSPGTGTGSGTGGTGGDTALMAAARFGNIAAMRVLLAHGASIKEQNEAGMTPLIKAIVGNEPEAVSFLLAQGADLATSRMGNDTPMLLAAVNGPGVVRVLLAHGGRVNERARDGDTPLLRAIRAKNSAAAELLMQAGGNVNAANNSEWTPLLVAVDTLPGFVPRLVAAGANVNARNREGETPLIRAVRLHRIEAVRALLAAHADPNLATGDGDTPLQMARRWRQPTAANLLIQAGARE